MRAGKAYRSEPDSSAVVAVAAAEHVAAPGMATAQQTPRLQPRLRPDNAEVEKDEVLHASSGYDMTAKPLLSNVVQRAKPPSYLVSPH